MDESLNKRLTRTVHAVAVQLEAGIVEDEIDAATPANR